MQPVDEGRLAGLLCQLHRRRFTGLLHVETDATYSVFSFRDGAIVFVEDSVRSQPVADHMLESGFLTREQFADVVSHATESLVDNEDVAFCEQAVALGYVTEAQVTGVMSGRMRAKVIQAMSLSGCRTELDESADSLSQQAEYPQDVGALVYIGVRTFYDEDLLESFLPEPSKHYMRLLAPLPAIASFFALDDDEQAFLRSLDSETKVAAFLRSSLVDRTHALQMLGLLRVAGMAEFASTPYAATPEPSGVRSAAAMTRGPAGPSHAPGAFVAAREVAVPSSGRRERTLGDDATGHKTRGEPAVVREERPFAARTPSGRSVSSQNIPAQTPKTVANDDADTSRPKLPPRPASTAYSSGAAAAVTSARAGAAAAAPSVGASTTSDDATAQALAEAKARAAKRAAAGATGAAHRIGKQLEQLRGRGATVSVSPATRAAPASAPSASKPAEDTEYAKAHLKEILNRRRQVSGSAKVPGRGSEQKRDPAQDLKQAQDLLRAQQFGRAEELLRGAVESAPADDLLGTYHLWAKIRSVQEPAREQLDEMRDLARKLIQSEEHGAFACYVLGHLAFVDKKDDVAEKFFRKAFARDKTMKDAERHILILERRKQILAQEEAAANRKIFGITISSSKKDG